MSLLRVAQEVEHNLAVVVLAEKRGWPELQGKMEFTALLARGRKLMESCPKDTSRACKEAPDAVPVLTQAASLARAKGTVRDQIDSLTLLGRAQRLTGNNADAASTFKTGLDLFQRERASGRAVSQRDETQLLNMEGDAYLSVADYDSAQQSYDQSLKIMPLQPEVYGTKALALRYNGQRPEALQVVLQGLQLCGPGEASRLLGASAKAVIRALQGAEFPKAEAAIKAAQAKGLPLTSELALVINRREMQNLDANWSPETAAGAQKGFEEALALEPSDPDVLAEIYADLARVYLLKNDLKQVDSYLAQAERLPQDQVSADNREWVDRIRAQYWLNLRDYGKAFAAALAAHEIKSTDDGDLKGAEALLGMAQAKEKSAGAQETPEQKTKITELYQRVAMLTKPLVDRRYPNADGIFIQASHGQGQAAESRKQFEGLVKRDPKDESALSALMVICSQYLFDFDCAFQAAKQDAPLHNPNEPGAGDAYLNLAEAAILVGQDDQTRNWLNIALNQPKLSSAAKSLVYLYRVWLAIRQGQSGQFSADFQSWRTATAQFRASQSDLDWLFLGARKALKDSQIGDKQKALLSAMMDGLENRDRPLPAWPGSEALQAVDLSHR